MVIFRYKIMKSNIYDPKVDFCSIFKGSLGLCFFFKNSKGHNLFEKINYKQRPKSVRTDPNKKKETKKKEKN